MAQRGQRPDAVADGREWREQRTDEVRPDPVPLSAQLEPGLPSPAWAVETGAVVSRSRCSTAQLRRGTGAPAPRGRAASQPVLLELEDRIVGEAAAKG